MRNKIKNLLAILSIILVVILSFNLTGCDKRPKLYILNWDEYIDEDLVETFEEMYGCKIVYEVALSNETMYNRIATNTAPYDIVVPSDYMISQFKEEGMLLEIDFSKLENYEAGMFDDKLEEYLSSDACVSYKNYAIPYFWGSLGIIYNTENLNEDEVSKIEQFGWNVMFDPSILPNKKVGMYESSRDAIAIAELYKEMSVNTLDEAKIAETENVLKQMNYSMWGTDDLKTSVVSGSLDYAMVYSGDFFDMLYSKYEESDEPEINFDFYTPNNNNVFYDGMVIPVTSRNTDLAYKFIDFMIEFENSLTNASYVGYCPTITDVYEAILADPEFEGIADHPSYYPGDITHGEVYKYLGRNVYGQFDDIFTNVKSK